MDLKPYFDAVVAAQEEVQRQAQAIDERFKNGDVEAALEMKSDLDAAQDRLAEAEALYEAMKKASQPSDVVKNFIPAAGDSEDEEPKVLTRGEFEKLTAREKVEFINQGGQVKDEEE